MYTKRKWLLGAFAIAAIVAQATLIPAAMAANDFPIGLIMPIKTVLGKQSVQAAEIAVDMVNKNGGVLGGRKIKLVVYDDNYSPAEGAAAAQRLIDQDKVKFMGGNYSSTVALAIIPIAQSENALYMASMPKATGVAETGYQAAFQLNTTAVEDGAALEKIFKEAAPKTVAYIGENTDFGRQFADSVKTLTDATGGKIVFNDFYDTKQSDFNSIVTRAKGSGADTLVTMGGVVEQYANVVRTAADIGFKPRNVIIGPGAMNNNVLKLAGKAAEGALSVDIYLPSYDNALNKSFVAAYKAKYGTEPEKTEELSFETVWLIASAINKAGTDDVPTVAKTLLDNSWETPRGTIRFGKNGRVEASASIVTIKGGKILPK